MRVCLPYSNIPHFMYAVLPPRPRIAHLIYGIVICFTEKNQEGKRKAFSSISVRAKGLILLFYEAAQLHWHILSLINPQLLEEEMLDRKKCFSDTFAFSRKMVRADHQIWTPASKPLQACQFSVAATTKIHNTGHSSLVPIIPRNLTSHSQGHMQYFCGVEQ